MFWRVHLYSKSDEIKQLKNDEQLAKVNKDTIKVFGIYLDDDMLPICYDEYVIMMRVKVMRMKILNHMMVRRFITRVEVMTWRFITRVTLMKLVVMRVKVMMRVRGVKVLMLQQWK